MRADDLRLEGTDGMRTGDPLLNIHLNSGTVNNGTTFDAMSLLMSCSSP